MKITRTIALSVAIALWGGYVTAAEHPGTDSIKQNGYHGPQTCENCHPGVAAAFLSTVHWKHASKVSNVDHLKANEEYGMKNRIYTMCVGSDTVNDLKTTPKNASGKTKFAGCNTCHPGNHVEGVWSTGPAAEDAIDCLICHASNYDYSKRKPYINEKGGVVMGQDRSTEAALSVGKPAVKNCMTCHGPAGGGTYVKRGFAFTKDNDVHAAKGMVCVDCHKGENHKIPTGYDPNNWANDGLHISCDSASCHGTKPHKSDAVLNAHTARIACQTCHIPRTGGALAKDFTVWQKGSDGFYEPSTLKEGVNSTKPVYAWYNHTVTNTPHFIGPKGSIDDPASKIYPFKIFFGKAYFDKKTGNLMSMDFAPPAATGDTLAGVASAAKTLGIKSYDPVPGWQTVYFGNDHLVTKDKALSCTDCHTPNGVLNFKALGYSDERIEKLTSPEIYFKRIVK